MNVTIEELRNVRERLLEAEAKINALAFKVEEIDNELRIMRGL